jgi:hypothetical protein
LFSCWRYSRHYGIELHSSPSKALVSSGVNRLILTSWIRGYVKSAFFFFFAFTQSYSVTLFFRYIYITRRVYIYIYNAAYS